MKHRSTKNNGGKFMITYSSSRIDEDGFMREHRSLKVYSKKIPRIKRFEGLNYNILNIISFYQLLSEHVSLCRKQ